MQPVPDNKRQVCAVVVTYQPSVSVVENVTLLSKQFSQVVVVDNGSLPEFKAILSNLEAVQGVFLIRNQTNLGIAAALNQGIRHAQARVFDWIATFDQDSAIAPDFADNMLAAYAACPFRDEVALVSPTYCESAVEWKAKLKAGDSLEFSLIRVAMTSGSLIRAKVFGIAGWYDEEMFIDYVDFDFCLRLRQMGYKTIRSHRSGLIHSLGTAEKHSFLGFPLTIKSHSAVRYYYIMRNRLIMYRRYALCFPVWAIHDLLWMGLDFTKIILWEKDKTAKLRNTIRGFRDGLANRLGPLIPELKKKA